MELYAYFFLLARPSQDAFLQTLMLIALQTIFFLMTVPLIALFNVCSVNALRYYNIEVILFI